MRARTSILLVGLLFVFAIQSAVQAAELIDDFTWIRGANYVPSYAKNDVQTWMDYDPDVVDAELGYAKQLNFNTVRVFLQQAVYEHQPAKFLADFESFLALCDKHGIKMMPVPFDSCFDPQIVDLVDYHDKTWMPSPGFTRLGEEDRPAMEDYIQAVVGAHKNDRRIVMWDVMNEPEMTGYWSNSEDRQTIIDFVEWAMGRIRQEGADQPLTVGWALSGSLSLTANLVDVIAFHSYSSPSGLDGLTASIKQLGQTYGKPVIINEFAGRGTQPIEQGLPIIASHGIGWVFWEMMIGRTQFATTNPPYQGHIYPDGTCYAAEEVATILNPAGYTGDPVEIAAAAGFVVRQTQEGESGGIPPLLTNGSFETEATDGVMPSSWSEDFNCHGAYDGATSPPEGTWVLHPSRDSSPGGAYQDIQTVDGKWYNVSLYIQNFAGESGEGNVKVLVGNPGTDSYTSGPVTTTKYSTAGLVDNDFTTSSDWTQESFSFQATGSTTRLGIYSARLAGQTASAVNVDLVGVTLINTITNESFENGSTEGVVPSFWNIDFNCYGAYGGATGADGTWVLHPGAAYGAGGAYQDITTVADQWYDVSLYVQNFNGASGEGNVKILVGTPGTESYTSGPITTSSYSTTGLWEGDFTTSEDWTQAIFHFKAAGATTRLGIYNAPLAGSTVTATNVDFVVVTPATSDPADPAANPDVTPDNGDGTVGTIVDTNAEVTLNWTAGPDPNGGLTGNAVNPDIVTHYVYLSADQNVSGDSNVYYIAQEDQVGQTADCSYGPLTLNAEGSYRWSIEEGLDDGTGNPHPPGDPRNIPGDIWTFNTVTTVSEVTIISQPVDTIGNPDAVFAISAQGADSWQWYKVGNPDIALSDTGTYSGTDSSSLTVTAPAVAEEGQYYCVASGSVDSETSTAATLWTSRLMGHWKFDGDLQDSVADTVAGAPTHDGSITDFDAVIGLDFGVYPSTNNFMDVAEDTIFSVVNDIYGNAVPGVSVSITGIEWNNDSGGDNGGLPWPFNSSNVNDWAGANDSSPVTISFSGLDNTKTYDFKFHAGWYSYDVGIQATCTTTSQTSAVVDTSPGGAPNIGTITGAVPDVSGNLVFQVASTIDVTAINAAALTYSEGIGGPPTYTGGIESSAIMFANESRHVEISEPDFFNFYPLGFSVSAWYQEDAPTGLKNIVSKVDPAVSGWQLAVNSPDDSVAHMLFEPGAGSLDTDAAVDVNDGQWHMITVTYDPVGTIARIYTDGKYTDQTEIDLSAYEFASDPLRIAGYAGSASVNGAVDDVRIYGYPLSPEEIAVLYTNFKPGEPICVIGEEDLTFQIYDMDNDCRIGLGDFAMFAERWLECRLIPAEACN